MECPFGIKNMKIGISLRKRPKIHSMMKDEFLRGATASETRRNINRKFRARVITLETVLEHFDRFRTGNFERAFGDEQPKRPERERDFDIEELLNTIENYPTRSSTALAHMFGVSTERIVNCLASNGYEKRSGEWSLIPDVDQSQESD